MFQTRKSFMVESFQPVSAWVSAQALQVYTDFTTDLMGPELAECWIDWVAMMFQNPDNQSKKSWCVYGEAGIGKMYLVEIIEQMMGDSASCNTNSLDISNNVRVAYNPSLVLVDTSLIDPHCISTDYQLISNTYSNYTNTNIVVMNALPPPLHPRDWIFAQCAYQNGTTGIDYTRFFGNTATGSSSEKGHLRGLYQALLKRNITVSKTTRIIEKMRCSLFWA